ncbi:Pentatricopeptide repeat [Dillenia turbinata]|uniref:Pentatricopeptide repeat n=1 Tax=Dillenia turbinata TaxID=194707 RepID=A0AAN8YUD1_9MAGN
MKQSKKYLPDTLTYTTPIDGCCKGAEMDMAMKYVDEAKRIMTKMRSDEAFKHLRDMVGRGMKMDVKSSGVVLNDALVEELVDLGYLDKAIHILKQMHQMGCSPNFLSHSTVILGISRARGGMQKVEELVPDLRQNEHELDASMYSCLSKGYCEDCNVQKTIQVFLGSMYAGSVISIGTFAILLRLMCKLEGLALVAASLLFLSCPVERDMMMAE